MTEVEKNELLVELNTNMKNVCFRLTSVEGELKKRRCLLHTKQLTDLEHDFDPKLCAIHSQKINLIMWIGIVIAGSSLVTLVKVFWSQLTKGV